MEERLTNSLNLFLGAVRKRLNQRKVSLEDFLNECKFKNKSKISIFEFAIIVQRINCGTSFFKAKQLFGQVNHRGDYLSMETFRNLFLKVSKIPLSDLEINMRKSELRNKSKTLLEKNKPVKTEGDQLLIKVKAQRSYYSEIGFNRLVQFVSHKHQRPQKIFNDCDLDRSGFIDRNEFNKFLVASQIFEFKDKDVRRYLISDVFEKLKTEKITKTQFFQIFSFKPVKPLVKQTVKPVANKPEKLSTNINIKQIPTISVKQSPNISVKRVGKSSEKKLDPVRTKVISTSIAVIQEPKNIPIINQRGGRRRQRQYQPEDSYGQSGDQYGDGYDDYGDYGGQGDYGNYGGYGGKRPYGQQIRIEYPYRKPQGFGKNNPYKKFMGDDYGDYGDIDPYYDPINGPKGYQQWYGPGKIDPRIPVNPNPQKPRPKPYNNPQIQPGYPLNPYRPLDPYHPVDPFQPDDPEDPQDPEQPEYPVYPVKPNNPGPVNPKKPQPSQPVVQYKKASQYYRLGAPKNKDLEYFKQFEQMLNNRTPFVDNQNPVIKPEFDYLPARQIFQKMDLNPNYTLFAQSDQSRNQQRNNKLFSKVIEADDIRQGDIGDCYFLCGIASIAYDYPQILAQKFLFDVNPVNYYVTKLFIDGEWKYLKTDDRYAFSIMNTGYCHPRQSQIWVMLMEKCFAKAFGDYNLIKSGTQTQAFFVLTGVHSQFYEFSEKFLNSEIKEDIISSDKKGYLMATAGGAAMMKLSKSYLEQIGLVSGHAYSLLSAEYAGQQLLIKLRNPWGQTVYKGDWSFNSNKWTPQLRKKFNMEKDIQNGTFYMSWDDFLKFFGCITICKLNPTFVHTSFKMMNNRRKSNYVEVKVPTKGTYNFYLCQENAREHVKNLIYLYSDARIILVRKNQNGSYQYIASKFLGGNQNRQFIYIETQLEPGTYLISAKISWRNRWQDHQAFLTCYGCQNVSFQLLTDRSIAPKFKADMIKSYALKTSSKDQRKDYSSYGMNGLTSQTHFNTSNGIGYFRLINKGNRPMSVNLSFMLKMQIKIIKPNTAKWNPVLQPGEQAVIGFFITGNFLYEVQQSFN